MIYLFRHAHAGRRTDWGGPDRERPLTERGWQESRAVAARLAEAGITRILTSPYLRCAQSVRPLSEATGVPIEVEAGLAEGGDPEPIHDLLDRAEPGTLLCSHGDIVEALIGRLAAEGTRLADGPAWEKGSIWELDRGPDGRIRSGAYHPPPVTAP